ncbi:hypothetical protein [Hamadaea tsunoensis]|uniref:hypothetical protein n=1 Tax=Hamadaea tsunoensis TaxID=53368 RepID=UPI000484E168|nr:hypothetical protein [Hamadaea tsunoensis]
MSKFSLFPSSSPGQVTLVEAPLATTYARKARLTFWVVGLSASVLGAVSLGYTMPWPIVGGILGVAGGLAVGLVCAVLVRIWPVLRAVWHWLPEITVFLAVVFGWTTLVHTVPAVAAVFIIGVPVAVVAAVPATRRAVIAVVWCAIDRHRVRSFCARALRASSTKAGCLPLILIARPTPSGERVWLWLRPGLTLADLEGRTGALAEELGASQVRVGRVSEARAAYVYVDIARRDPLRSLVLSPLMDLVDFDETIIPTSPGLPPVGGLDLPGVPEPYNPPQERRGGRRPTEGQA